jgi:hypothetical protein
MVTTNDDVVVVPRAVVERAVELLTHGAAYETNDEYVARNRCVDALIDVLTPAGKELE